MVITQIYHKDSMQLVRYITTPYDIW